MDIKLENGYLLEDDILYLDLRFSGLGLVEREEGKVLRIRNSFSNLSLEGIPLTLEHPKDIEGNNALLNDENSQYWVIGAILKEVNPNDDKEIRVIARIFDKTFIDLFLANQENIFNLLSTSPAVKSELVEIEEGKYFEIVKKICHLALLIESVGFWDSYITAPAVNENSSQEIELEEIETENFNNTLINQNEDFKMLLEKEVTSNKEEEVLDSVTEDKLEEVIEDKTQEIIEEIVEEIKENNPSDLREEVKEEVEETKILDSDKEEIIEEKDKEEIFEDDLVLEDFETEEDKEREILVTIASNLVDSLEDFRKPFCKDRVKPEIYMRKLLSLNKGFIDSKYHSVIDSVSLELGKEILSSINAKKQEKQELSKNYWLEIGNKRMRKF